MICYNYVATEDIDRILAEALTLKKK